MEKILILYFYPRQLVIGMIIPAPSYYIFCLIFTVSPDIFIFKIILYFGFVLYLSYLSFKNHERPLPNLEPCLEQLQSIHLLLYDAGIEGAAEKINREISMYLNDDMDNITGE